jgi:hypothetical protein
LTDWEPRTDLEPLPIPEPTVAWPEDNWEEHYGIGAIPKPILVRMDTVKPEAVSWLWRHRIPLASLVVMDGDPGIGKSTITIDLAARITRGATMPDGSRSDAGLGSVLLVGAEDALSFTVSPRLRAAGADLERVHALSGVSDPAQPGGHRPLSFPEDQGILERAILNTGAVFVVIDPIMAYLSDSINSNSDQEVRRVLTPLAHIAERTGATILMVRHLRKTNDGPALYQGGGSIGIVGAARAGLIVVRDPADESLCILKQSKTNLGPWPAPVGYFVTGDGKDASARIRWVP